MVEQLFSLTIRLFFLRCIPMIKKIRNLVFLRCFCVLFISHVTSCRNSNGQLLVILTVFGRSRYLKIRLQFLNRNSQDLFVQMTLKIGYIRLKILRSYSLIEFNCTHQRVINHSLNIVMYFNILLGTVFPLSKYN